MPLGQALDGAQVHAEAGDLHELRAASHDLVEAVRCLPSEVARPKLVDGPPERKVRGLEGVAEHDVRPSVHELAASRRRPGDRVQAQ
jgi:hypothetical protein